MSTSQRLGSKGRHGVICRQNYTNRRILYFTSHPRHHHSLYVYKAYQHIGKYTYTNGGLSATLEVNLPTLLLCLSFPLSVCVKKTSKFTTGFDKNLHDVEKIMKSTIRLPVELTHFLTDFLFFIGRKKVWNFAGIEKIVNVLEKRFLFYLNTKYTI